MKNIHTLRFRGRDRDIFEMVRNGVKKIETRAATPRYRRITRGDTVRFVCGGKKFKRCVKRARIFKTITSMLRAYRVEDIDPSLSSAQELRKKYYSFPNYKEKIRTYGLLAMEFLGQDEK